MKNLILDIKINALDGYLYNGELFIISKEGIVSSISFETLIQFAITSNPEFYSILNLAFLRNDWINNQQGFIYQSLGKTKSEFKQQWNKISNKKIEIEVTDEYISKYFECPSMPIFDIKAYGMRLYLGHRNGLHESILNFDKITNKPNLYKNAKVFDARSSYISAKSGEILISSNTDGLFSGTLWQNMNENIVINQRKIAEKSLRTGWATYNVINYEEQSKFIYLKNDIEKATKEQRYRFSMVDEPPEKVHIKEYGKEKYSLDTLLPNRKYNDEEIKYSFNSNTSIYFMLSNNKLIHQYLHENRETDKIYLSHREHVLPFKTKTKVNKPISTSFIPNGCIIEFYDNVFLIHKNKTQLIMNEPIFTIRTFPTSKRFKNIIIIFKENGISIQSIYPFDDEIKSI